MANGQASPVRWRETIPNFNKKIKIITILAEPSQPSLFGLGDQSHTTYIGTRVSFFCLRLGLLVCCRWVWWEKQQAGNVMFGMRRKKNKNFFFLNDFVNSIIVWDILIKKKKDGDGYSPFCLSLRIVICFIFFYTSANSLINLTNSTGTFNEPVQYKRSNPSWICFFWKSNSRRATSECPPFEAKIRAVSPFYIFYHEQNFHLKHTQKTRKRISRCDVRQSIFHWPGSAY